ncbi:MAG: hypothetical protein JSV30_04520 [Candidatus Omnitrophota bacterium]|nr:MAG: hypothetical protein JSV30_04520 [Candidatus Omnitrophota bacterium]
MINEFIQEYFDIVKFSKAHKKYIRGNKSKRRLSDFYEKSWLPYSRNFEKIFGKKDHDIIEGALYSIYKLCKKDFIEKKRIKSILNLTTPTIENIKLNLIRDFGFIIERGQKENIIEILKNAGFESTIIYIEDAENDFKNGKSKSTCTNTRHAIDEFFREFREKVFKKSISGVTASEHIAALNNKLKIPTSEQSLLKNGIYVFLSHKGGHGTTDRPSLEDAKLSINLIYICFEYFLNKYNKYFNKTKETNPFFAAPFKFNL